METLPDIYPLTGLQIGDIQSYVSQAFLYFSPLSKKLLILVDNRPWLINKHSRAARLWQQMVTKYRMSPFMNSLTLHKGSNTDNKDKVNDDDESSDESFKKSHRWLIKSAKLQTKRLLSTMDLSEALHGFLVFEVAWKNVHGINYLNELQTDTSLAIEVRCMKKWEFYSPDQASNCISLWFVGHLSETQSLKSYLRKLSDLDNLLDVQLFSKEMSTQKASPLELVSEEEFLEIQEPPTEPDNVVNALQSCGMKNNQNKSINEFGHDHLGMLGLHEEKKSLNKEIDESFVSPTQYSYTMILFKFRDNLLPSKLRQEIMSDIRLLTLLESGLPSWVIFFQSYPLFCHFYRPWMCHFARTLYILISLVTALIGFYDLYKNIPLLKATAARLCGPFFGWIEAWDMVTRIQYLGTMLFLRNLRKTVKLLILVARATMAILIAVSEPLAGPYFEVVEFIFPLWSACVKISELLSSIAWSVIESMCNLFIDLAEIFLTPFELLHDCFRTIATSICPLVHSVWEICLVLFQYGLTFASYMRSLLSQTYNLLKDIWETIISIFQLTYLSDTKQSPYDMSDLQDLWNNLFSQVFRAIRSILNGLLAFFMACNRHRLSIHNHMKAVMQHLFRLAHTVRRSCHCQKKLQFKHHNEEDFMECDHCQ
ncbi:uncharacterized protein [Typha latifolia]|uniref:uncharacterized protein isoform X1 n=2 Tax=Typha latifolia TaxID=4733 RepID=UPI003C2C85C7